MEDVIDYEVLIALGWIGPPSTRLCVLALDNFHSGKSARRWNSSCLEPLVMVRACLAKQCLVGIGCMISRKIAANMDRAEKVC